MFYLHVEITNYRQLKIVIPVIIDPLEKRINQIITSSGGEAVGTINGLFCFHSTFRETSLALIGAAFEIYRQLTTLKDKLYGFSLILSDSNWKDEDVESHIRNFIYRIPDQNGIWVLEDKKNNLRTHVSTTDIRGYKKVIKENEDLPGTAERMDIFCRREGHIESIAATLEELGNPLTEKVLVHLSGDFLNALDYNLEILLDRLDFDQSIPILVLNNHKSKNPLDPFLWSMTKGIEDKVSLHLDNDELDLWRLLSPGIELFRNSWNAAQCSDFIEEDCFSLYSLYLKAYIRIRKSKNLLPLILCKNVDQWEEGSIKFLSGLLGKFLSGEALIPLCTASNTDWTGSLKQGKVRTIQFKPYTVEELRKRLQKAFSDIQLNEKELFTLYKNCDAQVIPMFHSMLSYIETSSIPGRMQSLDGIIDGMDNLTLSILFLIQISNGLISKENFLDFFRSRKISESRFSERVEHLSLFSLIKEDDYLHSCFYLTDQLNRKVQEKGDLINSFTNFLFSLWQKGKHLNIELLFTTILNYGQIGKSFQLYQFLLDRFLNNKQFSLADFYLDKKFFDPENLSVGEKDALKNILFAGRMRSALLKENYRDVQAIISENEIIKVHKKSAYSSYTSLQHSIYMNCLGDYSRGLNLAKEALFEFQQSGDSAGEAKANIELAAALLGQGKIRTSQDYFEISRRASFQSKDHLCQIRSSFFKSLSDFIFGNIPMALRGVNDILPVAEKAGRREWILMIKHLKGRILFDLGRYRDCEDLYKEAWNVAQFYKMNDAAKLLMRWKARSLVYNERYKDGMDILSGMEECDETLFFLAEAAYLGKQEEKALEYLASAGMGYHRIDFIPGEIPFWRDGFASIEGYSLSRDGESDVLMNQIQAFRYYLMGLTGDLDNAVAGFSELTGRYNNQGTNLYFHKYFYLYAHMLPDSYNDEEKRLKILSNSVRLLQSRAGRFDDQKMKHSYLNYNLWNKRITEESVKRNFI